MRVDRWRRRRRSQRRKRNAASDGGSRERAVASSVQREEALARVHVYEETVSLRVRFRDQALHQN